MTIFIPIFFLVVILYGLGNSLVPLMIAGISALLCAPYLEWFKSKGIKRPYSTLLVTLSLFLPILILVAAILPLILQEAKEFLQVLPENMTKILDQVEALAIRIGVSLHYDRKDVIDLVHLHSSKISVDLLKTTTEMLKQSAGNITHVLLAILNIFLIPIFFFYLVTEKNYWKNNIKSLIPQKHQEHVIHLLTKSRVVLKSYFYGQWLACWVLAGIYAVGLLLVGLKFAILIGLTTGLLTFIPYVGFSIGLGLGVLVAYSTGGVGEVGLVLIIFLIGQILETFVVTPKFVGSNVGLSALESILAIIIFGNLFGFVGILIAIPASAVIKLAIAEYVTE